MLLNEANINLLEIYFKKNKLPGLKAQQLLSPNIRNPLFQALSPDNNVRLASVLILLYIKNHELYTIVIKRQSYNGAHSGQISLPGGKHEKSDINLIDTALRETKEEININPKNIKIIGELSELFIPVSNYNVFPYVGIINKKFKLIPEKAEVVEIFEVPVNFFLDENNIKMMNFFENDILINAPYFDINGNKLWGATAMILSELIEILKLTIVEPSL